MLTGREKIPKQAVRLGYLGVVPFLATAVLIAFDSAGMRQMALEGFLAYSAVILSFLGGIRWGAASSGGSDPARELIVAVLPSLWAAFFLWLPAEDFAVWGLMLGFVLMGLADWFSPGLHVASWMRPLRLRLTLAVLACHLAVATVI